MQTTYTYPSSMLAKNDAYASTTESVMIQASVIGFMHFNVSITNYGAGAVTDVSIYASADGFNYYTVQAAAIASIASGSTANYVFTSLNRFIKITATSGAAAHLYCCLVGEQ